jgi:hypothetical protein
MLNKRLQPLKNHISNQQLVANFSNIREKGNEKGEEKRGISHPTSWSLKAEDTPAHACAVDGLLIHNILENINPVHFKNQPRVPP